jgi:hypothetical protein
MKKKIKLGLLVDPNRKFQDWEINLFTSIRASKFCEIKVIFYEPNKLRNKSSFKNFLNLISKRNIFKSFFNLSIKLVEKKFDSNLNKKNYFFRSIPKVKIYSQKKSFVDYFNKQDIKKIKEFKLDVILRRDFRIIRGNILNAARYGIWSLHHGDNDFIRGITPGFWETFYNLPITGVTLQKINEVLDGGDIIDKGYYGTKFFWKHNENFIKEKSVQIVLKNLKNIYDNKKLKFKKSKTSLNTKYYNNPKLYHLIIYIIKKYPYFVFKKISRFLFPINLFLNKWKICEIKSVNLNNFEKNKKNKNFNSPFYQYWADPFYFKHDKKNFLFFENYNIFTRRGKISCGEILNDNLIKIKDIMDKNYHFSYPNIFRYGKKIFMIPETAEKKRVEIWICKKFPEKWKLYKTIFEGESWVDINFFKDKKGNKWLLGNKSNDKYLDHNSELYIYKVNGDNFNKLIPHEKNPVLIDSRVARNAGKIFYNNKGELIRPSQVNIYEKYGYGLNLNRITKLTLNDYQETILKKITASKNSRLLGVHHFSLGDSNIYIDKLLKF